MVWRQQLFFKFIYEQVIVVFLQAMSKAKFYLQEKNQMKTNTLFSIIILVLISANSSVAQKKEFGRLIGTWKLKGENVFETWTLADDGKSLNAVSKRINGTQSSTPEETKLVFKKNSFYYIPDVTGEQGPVDFKITSFDENGFVAENPNHDFPKLIRYKFVTKDGKEFIEAAIEGDGKVIPYDFEKVQ
jgi:hypothetical protein